MEGMSLQARVTRNYLAVIVVLLILSPGRARDQAPKSPRYDPAKVARALELLEQARKAAGGKEKLEQVASLEISMHVRRFFRYISVKSPVSVEQKEKTLKASLSIEILLPDKFRKHVSSTTLTGFSYSYDEVVNGKRAWRDPPLRAPSSSRDQRVIDVADFERNLAYEAQNAREQLSFYTLAWLIRSLPGHPAEFNFEGWMQTEGGKVDVLSVYASYEFETLMMLDQTTHLPAEFESTYLGVHNLPVIIEGVALSRKDYDRMIELARQQRKAQATTPRRIILSRRVSDFRLVSGILFPHRLVTSIDGKPAEELDVTSIHTNRRPNPNHFEQKPQKKPQ